MKTKLPPSHEPYTDKYFLRTNQILKAEGLNPQISMKVFARGEGPVVGLDEAVEVLTKYSDLEKTGEIWTTEKEDFETKEPLMIIKGPAQSFIELETMYLGVLSHNLTEAVGISAPKPAEIKEKLQKLKDIYQDIPIVYFGARHYHWSLDKMIAGAALEGGAVQTSSDIGSSNVGLKGVGTTPHALTLILASTYGKTQATLETAYLFDKHMPEEIPRVTLVDTFNRELTDSLMVAKYFGKRNNGFRIDTCGENIGEGGLYNRGKHRDPTFKKGTGVTIELARNLRNNLVKNGFGEYTNVFLSSSFGNEDKAKAFVQANELYKQETGFSLFEGVGIGEVSKARFCTADIFEVDGKSMYKTGRPVENIDYSVMKRVV